MSNRILINYLLELKSINCQIEILLSCDPVASHLLRLSFSKSVHSSSSSKFSTVLFGVGFECANAKAGQLLVWYESVPSDLNDLVENSRTL